MCLLPRVQTADYFSIRYQPFYLKCLTIYNSIWEKVEPTSTISDAKMRLHDVM